MDEKVAVISVVAILAGTFMVTFRSFLGARRGNATAVGSGDAARLSAQLDAMQQQLDTMQIEIERVSEGQRFTTKLLSEQAASASRLPG